MHPRQLDFIKLQARLSKGVAIGSWGARNPSFVSLFFVTPITCHMSIIQLNPVLSLVHLIQVARILILLYDFRPRTARSFRLTPAAVRLELRTIPDCSKKSKTF